ncbi:PDZ domain-containing protein [Paenibacillus chitinolyticus]|uniref:PDZ domain-containing protein n=1 Tax=Paenibacillus chitinolyticus TaxID=79263 RepID=UPI00365F9FF3
MMIPCSLDRTINVTYLEAPLVEVWRSIATPEGMNTYLTYTAEKTGSSKDIRVGDVYTLCYGDILNHPVVTECRYGEVFAVRDRYESIAPDGRSDRFDVQTRFTLAQEGAFVKLTLEVTGFEPDTYGQWFRECLEMGWRRSLMNLKSVVELGMDLRAELFSYPRLGVVNCTVNADQSAETGVAEGEGNYLMEVFPNSPAAAAGLRKGDVIVSFDETPTPNYSEFVRVISSYHHKKERIRIGYIRDGARKETPALLSVEETFTGLVDVETETYDDIRRKRETLARQRSASGSLWKQKQT